MGERGGRGAGASGASGSAGRRQRFPAVVWGSDDWRRLALDKGSLDWSGGLFSAHVGVDALFGERLRGGSGDRAAWRNGACRGRRSCRLGPAAAGWSFALLPRWGVSESALARLWDEGMAGRAFPGDGDAADGARLETELGYGFGFREGAGVMTPHAGFGYEEGGARCYRLGTRFEFGSDLTVGLPAERKEGAADPEHGTRLELRLRW